MIKQQHKKNEQKQHVSFAFKFSGAAILGISFSTLVVFSVMWYFNSNKTIGLQDLSFLSLFLLTLFLSVIITFTLRKIFINPLITLTDAMNKVAAGDFSIRLDSDSQQNDLAEVYDSFNTMVKELSQTDTLQKDFINNVSHEFKTPINAIEGYASLLQDSSLSKEEESEYVEKIMFNTRRISGLVSNVLLLSKVDNQVILPEATTYRLDEQIRQSILALESKWEPKNIEFDIEMEVINYNGVENLLGHVWINLIENAVKFSYESGYIKIRLYREHDTVIFTIFNNGAFIPEESLELVFTKFYQCDSSRKSEGNGLGLSLVKMILDVCGGKISVKSSQASGTEFKVSLTITETAESN